MNTTVEKDSQPLFPTEAGDTISPGKPFPLGTDKIVLPPWPTLPLTALYPLTSFWPRFTVCCVLDPRICLLVRLVCHVVLDCGLYACIPPP